MQVALEALAVGASQAIWSQPEPIVIKAPTPQPVVMSAPPVDTNEFSCDPLPVDTLGKKLQVMPEPLSTTISQTAFTPTQLAVSTGQSMYTEPKTTTYRSSTAQSRPLETVGKKLQVAPDSLVSTVSQATL
uniref:BRCA2 n=1 Tax=Mesocestoides corti TaxID=53468 RepID=A0A5K3G5P1_MESCO